MKEEFAGEMFLYTLVLLTFSVEKVDERPALAPQRPSLLPWLTQGSTLPVVPAKICGI